ncbi:MAG: hypothetical protein KDC40_12905 [Actinobacteria bacterium]|nr:hypothetical protein [Actinomycetota bacterium]
MSRFDVTPIVNRTVGPPHTPESLQLTPFTTTYIWLTTPLPSPLGATEVML